MTDHVFCTDCRAWQEVVDQFLDDTGDSRRMVEEYFVTVLACGHSRERKVREYPSPLQQAGPLPSWSAPDPFAEEGF